MVNSYCAIFSDGNSRALLQKSNYGNNVELADDASISKYKK